MGENKENKEQEMENTFRENLRKTVEILNKAKESKTEKSDDNK